MFILHARRNEVYILICMFCLFLPLVKGKETRHIQWQHEQEEMNI